MKILISQGCRSDIPLSDPIIKRLKADPFFEVIILKLNPESFGDSYFKVKTICLHEKPDLFLAIGDRVEMAAGACAAFHTNIPIAHYGAGITNYPISTWDDINRHCITLWSDIVMCEDKHSAYITMHLWYIVNKIVSLRYDNIYIVGHSHLDDIEVDESLVPKISQGCYDIPKPYDLVLYNPTTMYKEEFGEIIEDLEYDSTIWIGSNPDPSGSTYNPKDYFKNYYENLPRSEFLGLLKSCKRFISNSSCVYYEAPLFLKPEQIIIIGDRNKNRSTKFDGKPGASDKIVEILKEYWSKKNVQK